MASHPELQAEQAHLDRAYERLESLRAGARARLQAALRQRGGTPQAVTERDVIVRNALHRLEQLELGGESLCFGRIDRTDGQSFHIGRLAISGEDQEPLVVDWRAPVAESFYRATGRHPMGLSRRRHLATEGRRVVGIEDELFGDDSSGEGPGHGLVGPGALVAALERSRSGRMRDIVATVQVEQDEVIRSELPGVLVVQGGPGTGKTAVALHRAAYLLYTHRFPLERQGVLVVGPNPIYLRYVRHVLPSLGETGVALTTVQGLVPRVRARAEEAIVAARVKGDSRMAQVLARAVSDRQRPLRRPLEVGFEGQVLRLSPEDARRVVAFARRRVRTHNAGRRHVEAWLARHFIGQYRLARQRRRRAGASAEPDGDAVATPGAVQDEEVWPQLRRHPDVVGTLDRMWPVLAPEELVHDLFGAPPLLRLAASGVLSDEEVASLHRERSSGLDSIPWTAADLALIDEARALLGPRRPSADADAGGGGVRTYGHIVVDEAQDLTPMQLRMLARRSLSGSMTVVGDIAQATGPWAPGGWSDVTAHLPDGRAARVAELSVNYRTPDEVMTVASRVLARVAPDQSPPVSVRATGASPAFVAARAGRLGPAVADTVVKERGEVHPGTLAVIAPPSLVEPLASALGSAGVAFSHPGGSHAEDNGLDGPTTLLAVGVAKGLEFDAVVVAEPRRIVSEEAQQLRALYVALTRATKRLAVVHAEPLPAVLTERSTSLRP